MMVIATLIVIISLFAVIIVPDRRAATMLLLIAIAERPLLSCRYVLYYEYTCVCIQTMLGSLSPPHMNTNKHPQQTISL